MAKVLYSTHYAAPGGEQYGTIWSSRVSGLFQVKEDNHLVDGQDKWEMANTRQVSPAWQYEENDFDFGRVDLIDYDVARHWPHP